MLKHINLRLIVSRVNKENTIEEGIFSILESPDIPPEGIIPWIRECILYNCPFKNSIDYKLHSAIDDYMCHITIEKKEKDSAKKSPKVILSEIQKAYIQYQKDIEDLPLSMSDAHKDNRGWFARNVIKILEENK